VHKIVPDLVKAAQEAVEENRFAGQLIKRSGKRVKVLKLKEVEGWWLVSVPELQAAGHFPALTRRQREDITYILALDAECPVRQHLITHREWWNNEENANALDELYWAAALWYDGRTTAYRFDRRSSQPPSFETDWPEGGEKLKPRTLLRRLREAADLRELGPDVRFSHLDCYEDPPAEGEHSLRVLRSSHQVSSVGKQLHNCARSYINRVKEHGYVLVAAFEGEKPTALAGWDHRRGRQWDHRPVAVNNRNVDAGVRKKFDEFLPALVKAKPKGDVTCSRHELYAGLSARNRQYLEFVRGIGTVHPDYRQVHPDLPGE
jgi:hypothetical protein